MMAAEKAIIRAPGTDCSRFHQTSMERACFASRGMTLFALRKKAAGGAREACVGGAEYVRGGICCCTRG